MKFAFTGYKDQDPLTSYPYLYCLVFLDIVMIEFLVTVSLDWGRESLMSLMSTSHNNFFTSFVPGQIDCCKLLSSHSGNSFQ